MIQMITHFVESTGQNFSESTWNAIGNEKQRPELHAILVWGVKSLNK